MARTTVLLIVCGGLLVLPAVRGYSSGLVSTACGSMTPSHRGAAAQTTPSPFNVTTDVTTFQDGDNITVRLQSTGSTPFWGFMLQAREVGGETPLGSFTVTGGAAQLLTCSQEPSPILSYSGLLPNATPTSIGTTASSVGSLTTSMLSISSDGCGVTKVCFSKPLNCNPAVDRACYFMSAAVSTPPSGPVVQFEMKGPSSGYIAFGFSDDQQMGNDDIYICVLDTNGLVQVQHAFSTGKHKPDTLPLAHLSLMSLTVLASSIAFIVIFSYVRGWSGGAHPILGCLVMILAFVQPLGALFRCGPDHHLYVDHWLLF
ncbi:hypothetical protein CRUP_024700, partial [Coryphaenoides rupestris]